MEERFDRLAKGLEQGMSRRSALRLMGATVGATAFALVTGRAAAAPRLCRTCSFGTGQPCNVRSTTCIPASQSCPTSDNNGHRLCGSSVFHCPHGC